MDRFMLVENVNREEDTRPIYILQTSKPAMLIHIIPFDNLDDVNYKFDDVFDLFRYVNPDGLIENYMLKMVRNYDFRTEQAIDLNIQKIRKDINKAWRWYLSYLQAQDAEIDRNNFNPKLN